MQTNLPEGLLNTVAGQRANEILRKCVHCGFCNATCPTHQVTGDELDGPRGRIYLIKEMLEDNPTTQKTLSHLDNCLSCLSCETTCPSGVKFGELMDIGRAHSENKRLRNWRSTLKRRLLCWLFPYPRRFKPVYTLATLMGMTPKHRALQTKSRQAIKSSVVAQAKPSLTSQRKVILLNGCVQSVTAPEINQALTTLLHSVNIQTISLKETHCCGAIHYHNGAPEKAINIIKRNIDHWWQHINTHCEAIVMTASGCGLTVKDYARIMQHEPDYAEKARCISQLTQDASEYLSEFLTQFSLRKKYPRFGSVAFHPPCTLQHGQKVTHIIEDLLQQAGFNCVDFADKHLCCGSAGTYSLLQPALATQLKVNKIHRIMQAQPDVIATANIGCQLHLQQGSRVPVKHWLELIDIHSA